MRALDVVQQAVLDKDLAAAPASPADGDRYIVAADPTGAGPARPARSQPTRMAPGSSIRHARAGLPGWPTTTRCTVHDGAGWDELSVAGGGGGAALDALGDGRRPSAGFHGRQRGARSLHKLRPLAGGRCRRVSRTRHHRPRYGEHAQHRRFGSQCAAAQWRYMWNAAQTISSDAGGSAQLSVASNRGLSTSLRYNGTAGQGELKIQSNLGTFNVLSIQNLERQRLLGDLVLCPRHRQRGGARRLRLRQHHLARPLHRQGLFR